MATLQQIEKALRNAHEAGDTAAAQKLAQAYKQQSSQQQAQPAAAPQDDPFEPKPNTDAQYKADQNTQDYRGSSVDRFVRGIGAGAADILGAPADLMNKGLSYIGMDVDRPWLGSENIERGLSQVGMAPYEGYDRPADESLAGSIGQGAGNAAGVLLPFGAAARSMNLGQASMRAAAPSTAGTGRLVADQLARDVVTRPGMFAASEFGGNMAASGARYAGEEAGVDPNSASGMALQFGAGLAGGLTPNIAQGAAKAGGAAVSASVVPTVVRGAVRGAKERANIARSERTGAFQNNPIDKYSPETLDRTAEVLRGQASNVNRAQTTLDQPNLPEGVALSPAQQSGDTGLMALENRINNASPARADAARRSQQQAQQQSEEVFTGLGENVPVSRAGEELVRRRTEFAQRMDQRIQKAQQKAQKAAESVQGARGRAAVSTEMNRELDNAYRELSREVNNVWNKVDRKATVSAEGLLGTYAQIRRDIGEAGKLFGEDIPAPLARLMAKGRGAQRQNQQTAEEVRAAGNPDAEVAPVTSTVGEMQELRRILNERAAAYGSGANPDRYRERLMKNMVRAIDDDFATASEFNDVITGTPIEEAIAATRQLSDRFRRDGIAKSLATSSTGGEQIPAEQILERLLPMGSQGSSTGSMAGARQIYKAINESAGPVGSDLRLPQSSQAPKIHRGLQEYFVGEFQRRAAPNGQIDVPKARKFLQDNAETLSLPQFSDLRVRLRNVADAAERGGADAARAQKFMDQMTDPRQSRAAMFLGTDTADGTYQNAITNVLRGDAGKNMREIVRQVRKDPAGEAIKGLKTGYTRQVLQSLRTNTGLPDGNRMLAIFSDGATDTLPRADGAMARAARELFSKEERQRLREAATVFKRMQESADAGETPPDVKLGKDSLSYLGEIGARVMGANIGTMFGRGGGSIQTANIGSQAILNLSRRLAQSPVETALGDAVNNPEMFRALLGRGSSPSITTMADKPSRSHILGSWVVQLPMYGEEEQQQPTQ